MFYSTSLYYEQAEAFVYDKEYEGSKGFLLEIRVLKNTKALYIGGNTDYEVDGYKVNEKELLLSNKTKYKVIDVEDWKIVLEVQ